MYDAFVDGVHDLGGVDGFGPVRLAGTDEVASAPWELRAHALALLAAGESLRPWIEALPPATYLSTPYFGRWLLAIEHLLGRRGTIQAQELRRWRDDLAHGSRPIPRADSAEHARAMDVLMTTAADLPAPVPARFVVGDRVRVERLRSSVGVSRCPRYVRGATGEVEHICGAELPLDRPATSPAETVYTIAFASTDLWGQGD